MTNDVTTSLRELVEKATNGPWEARPFEEAHPEGDWFLTQGWSNLSADMSKDDATLIAAALNALPGLLDEREEYARENRDIHDICDAAGVSRGDDYEEGFAAFNAYGRVRDLYDTLLARALSAEGEVAKLRQAMTWVDDPFVDATTPIDEIMKRIRFMRQDAEAARLSIGKGNGGSLPGPVTNADAACSLRETLVPGEEGQR